MSNAVREDASGIPVPRVYWVKWWMPATPLSSYESGHEWVVEYGDLRHWGCCMATNSKSFDTWREAVNWAIMRTIVWKDGWSE